MQRIVLSASRRTDIPAFYMDWFMAGIERGGFVVPHPFTGQRREVAAGPDRVHTIVFWSKNFAPFLNMECGEKLLDRGYHLFFNFTVNSADRRLEPRLPSLAERLDQLGELAARFGPERIQWRFDPICFYTTGDGRGHDNLGDFETIAVAAARAGVSTCVTSFVDLYRKVIRRAESMPGFSFTTPDPARQTAVITAMEQHLAGLGLDLVTCCEKEVLANLPPGTAVRAGACIPGRDFVRRDGGSISLRQDSGQRAAAGCGCTISSDIGSYREQPCFHNCLFCYANPTVDIPDSAAGRHRRRSGAGDGP
ncbi:MAG: DUF1848 family protein [Desulfosudaceae bacterium]